jgi:hypothetical protein
MNFANWPTGIKTIGTEAYGFEDGHLPGRLIGKPGSEAASQSIIRIGRTMAYPWTVGTYGWSIGVVPSFVPAGNIPTVKK